MSIPDSSAELAASIIPITELDRRLADDPALTLIDVRPMAAYNGWRLNGEERGGHVPGAAAFPVEWLSRLDDAEVDSLLQAKGVGLHQPVVVYGYETSDGTAFAARLAALGHDDIAVLESGFPAWAVEEDRPIERLHNFDRLVFPAWVRQLIEGGRPERHPQNGHLVFHVNFGVPAEYAEGHLPGALYLDTNLLEDPDGWNRRTADELHAILPALGITQDTTVILYGRDTVGDANEKWPGRRAGQIAATRAALILSYAGVRDVRVLDGGYDHWVAAGYPVETELRQPTPVEHFGVAIPQLPEFIVDIDDARAILADDQAALVSVRSWKEHIGRVSGYNYIARAGRIPGDVWGNCGTDAYHMQHYRNVDNTMRAYPEIAANWQQAGITPEKWVAFYCGTGWRAAETWFYALLMGWPRIAVYDGGWFEWSGDPRNPIEVGEETDAVQSVAA